MCLAIPGKIVEISQNNLENRLGRVDFGGIIKTVNLSYVPEAGVGDYVTVHVGFALSLMDSHEAQQVLDHLKQVEQKNQQRLHDISKRVSRS
ncbi:HypC/HybG/HupF family hydrogenase formation chaperone [candidate division KSB1 bacterium]|nr:HypC/HybG/HupF family hydrogenase formation chaperone [candidate division KSB1 bacterium]